MNSRGILLDLRKIHGYRWDGKESTVPDLISWMLEYAPENAHIFANYQSNYVYTPPNSTPGQPLYRPSVELSGGIRLRGPKLCGGDWLIHRGLDKDAFEVMSHSELMPQLMAEQRGFIDFPLFAAEE